MASEEELENYVKRRYKDVIALENVTYQITSCDLKKGKAEATFYTAMPNGSAHKNDSFLEVRNGSWYCYKDWND